MVIFIKLGMQQAKKIKLGIFNFVFEQLTAAQNCAITCYFAWHGTVIPAMVR
jgi:hypothetical protein